MYMKATINTKRAKMKLDRVFTVNTSNPQET